MNLANLRIAQRLALAFGLVVVAIAGLGAAGLTGALQAQAAIEKTLSEADRRMALALAMRGSLLDAALHARNIGLLSEVPPMQAEAARATEAAETYANAAAALRPMLQGPEDLAAWQHMQQLQEQAAPLIARALALGQALSVEEAGSVLIKRLAPVQHEWLAEIDRLIQRNVALKEQDIERALNQNHTVAVASAASAGTLSLLTLLGAWLISRSIVEPISSAARVAARVARGDLTGQVDVQGRDEAAGMLKALSRMNGGLADIVLGVREASHSIAAASHEIARGNLDLSTRTERVAATLEEAAASVSVLSHTVQRNAQDAQAANQLAGSTAEVAERGGSSMQQVEANMAAISTSAARVNQMIAEIESIAFQTNILALNAAVESARAGEQGRGFAVVAAEVRTLAHRSAQAAREIGRLTRGSVEDIARGTHLVRAASQTIGDVVNGVGQIRLVMERIARASHEQASSLAEVSSSVAHVDGMTQQNAALVEQASAAASSLDTQARRLTSSVSVFKVAAVNTP